MRVTDSSGRAATSDGTASPPGFAAGILEAVASLGHSHSGSIQEFHGTTSSARTLFSPSGILESPCSTGTERGFLCTVGFILIEQTPGRTVSSK